MNILLVSQCNNRALNETRRILDQFAERKGDRTWQTAITQEGLNTLRKLLRKSARRNTAVVCHWIKGSNQSELLWVVGNLRRFNYQGTVPTSTTGQDILKSKNENQWHSTEAISLLASLAGLFHDFGKANFLFQQSLKGKGKHYQPYRHEWVSLRLFRAWVADRTDEEWLKSLSLVSEIDEQPLLDNLHRDGSFQKYKNPFIDLPPVATTVAWLILSHHRLPVYSGNGEHSPDLSQMESWLTQQLNAEWNSTNHINVDWTQDEHEQVWNFPDGTPLLSGQWRAKAQKFAGRALKLPSLHHFSGLNHRFTCHLARLVLMLADHHYSSLPPTSGWQDEKYKVWANTYRLTGQRKQKLDEHNIAVSQNAFLLGRSLPEIRKSLPAITRHKGFKQRSSEDKYRWQDRAFDLTSSIRERTLKQGFFGINMASTGCGKTFANARIMYALGDENLGCRFSVALGLRTLTLQTGDALKDKLHLDNDDLAVLIGSESVRQLHNLQNDKSPAADNGSEDEESVFAEHQYVRYDGSLDDGRLSHWLSGSPEFHQLISAPVLVTTVDHLIGATEGIRGGKQIAPMLRLLTSDLVLDEPDDFDIADLPALCRLVNWAGMLGSRVLLSSATLPPALIESLYYAYRAGRADYQQVCGEPGLPVDICCAWFDEHIKPEQYDISAASDFKLKHEEFVISRVKKLQEGDVLRRARLIPVVSPDSGESNVLESMVTQILTSMQELHADHYQYHETGKRVSLGLVRMANINPLVAVAKRLISIASPADMHIHYCIYHSHHPLAMRSYIERRLDETLNRYDTNEIWQITEISRVLDYPQKNHLFVVLATSVAEVGRDHDYDWSVAEPSSARSIIQLAGRVQRHRQKICTTPNIHILQKNRKALLNSELAYYRPGFESRNFTLNSHDLSDVLLPIQYQIINAIPRIQERQKLDPKGNFVDLEHTSLRVKLQGVKNRQDYYAALWWREQATWCAEQQRLTPFRKSTPEELHYLWLNDETDQPVFKFPDNVPGQWKQNSGFRVCEVNYAAGVSAWISADYLEVYQQLAEALNIELCEVSRRFGEISLQESNDGVWHYHPLLGVFGALE